MLICIREKYRCFKFEEFSYAEPFLTNKPCLCNTAESTPICNTISIELQNNVMGGRGRCGSMTFNTELLGVGRGGNLEPTPASALEPPPAFPPLPVRPKLPLNRAEHAYLVSTHKVNTTSQVKPACT